MTAELATTNTTTVERLAKLRGNAPLRSPNVRVLASYAQNTHCPLATLGFASGIDFDRLLADTRYRAPFGQSPFAIQRGLAFERMLRSNDYALTNELLRGPLGWPCAPRLRNLRDGFPQGGTRMPARVRATTNHLREIIGGANSAPHFLDGAVVRTTVGGVVAYFEADALAVHSGAGDIRVAEVKSFPKVDERVDPDQLGAALDQVAVYVLLARGLVRELGGDPERLVSDRALLITPRNVGLTPTLSEQRVSSRVTRMERVFRAIPDASAVISGVPSGLSFGPVADPAREGPARVDSLHEIADRVGTAYSPGCLSTCGNARFCRARAVAAGSPCVIGSSAVRQLSEIVTIARADSLSRGAKPTAAETPAATLLERAGRLIDESLSLGRGA